MAWYSMQRSQYRSEISRRQVYIKRLSLVQGGVTAGITLLSGLTASLEASLSALTGALIALFPYLYFVYRSGVLSTKASGSSSALRLFRAESGKFGLTVALFIIAFTAVPPSNPAFLFSAYAAVVMTHWLASWLMPRRRSTD